MELVPIVITALEIVLALAVITFIVSYVSFKIRSKVSPEQYEAQQDMKPKFATRRLDRLTYVTKEIMHVSKPKPVVPKPVKPIEPPQFTGEKKSGNKPRRMEVESKPKRVEIIKDISGNGQRVNDPARRITDNTNSLNSHEEDILKKYDDNENQKFFNLKTNRDNPKE